MKFDEFEELMHSNGVNSLAEIARMLNTTPQAVSNWKSRNQIPNHIILRINSSTTNFINIDKSGRELSSGSLGFGQKFHSSEFKRGRCCHNFRFFSRNCRAN